LILSGCESPTGSTGAQGEIGPALAQPGQEVTPELLANWFKTANTVVLPAYPDGETTISGVIPSGKTLVLGGGDFVLKQQDTATNTPPEALLVQGGLVLKEGSALDAGYYNATVGGKTGSGAGWLKLDGGSLSGEGTVKLPYIVGPDPATETTGATGAPDGLVHYLNAPGGVKKLSASYIGDGVDASKPVTELVQAGLVEIFKLLAPVDESGVEKEGAINEFTTKIKTTLTDNSTSTSLGIYDKAVPAGKTLTLKGDGNLIDGTVAGELIVDGTLEKTGSIGIVLPVNGKLHVNGTLTVNSLNLSLDTQKGALVVDGKLESSGDVTGGTVSIPAQVTASISLKGSGTSYQGNGDPNILIGKDGVLDLGKAGKASGITNNGTVTSAATTQATAQAIIVGFAGSGKVELSGNADLSAVTASIALKQNLVITGTLTAPPIETPFTFPSGGSKKTIKIAESGILALGNATKIKTTSFDSVSIENEGIITTTSTDLATLAVVIGLFKDKGALALEYDHFPVTGEFTMPAYPPLTGSIVVGNGGKLITPPGVKKPFTGNTVIDILNGGTLELDAAGALFSGVKVDNKGTIITKTTKADALDAIAKLGGKVVLAGAVEVTAESVVVPTGTELASLPGGGSLTVSGTGNVLFAYGSSYAAKNIGVSTGYAWAPDAPYSTITLKSSGIELIAGKVAYNNTALNDKLLIAEGATLVIKSATTVNELLSVSGTLDIPSGVTLTLGDTSGAEGSLRVNGTVNVKGVLAAPVANKLTVNGTIAVKSGGTYSSDSTHKGTGEVVFEYGSTGTEGKGAGIKNIAGKGSKYTYNWSILSPYSKVALLTGGALGPDTILDYTGDAVLKGTITLAAGANLVFKDEVTINGTLTVAAGATLGLPIPANIYFSTTTSEIVLEKGANASYGTKRFIGSDDTYIFNWDSSATGTGEIKVKASGLTEVTKGTVTAGKTVPIQASTKLVIAEPAKLILNRDIGIDVASSATLEVKGNLVVDNGVVSVAKGGTIIAPKLTTAGLPDDNKIDIKDNGAVVIAEDAIGYYGDSAFIGPKPGSGANPFFYNWDNDTATTDGVVTLKADNVTELTAGKVTAAKSTGIAADTAIIVTSGAKLTLDSGVVFTVAGTFKVLGEDGFDPNAGEVVWKGNWRSVKNVSSKYALKDKDDTDGLPVRGNSGNLTATALEVLTFDSKPTVTVTLASKNPASPLSGDVFLETDPSRTLWGVPGSAAPRDWGWADVAFDGAALFNGLTGNFVSLKSRNHAYRYYAGNAVNADSVLSYPISTDAGSIYIPATTDTVNTVPMRWKVFAKGVLGKSGGTLTILLGSGVPATEKIITFNVYKHMKSPEDFADAAAVSAAQDKGNLVSTFVINYEGVNIAPAGNWPVTQ
jgi:hypothetical protein